DRASVLESMDYARTLLERFGADGRLQIYVAPLAPFLDPGSLAFENPDKYGYRLRARTLAEHRNRLAANSWEEVLNYDSEALPHEELVDTTYEAIARLIEAKLELGHLAPEQARRSLDLIHAAQRLFAETRLERAVAERPPLPSLAPPEGSEESLSSCRVYDQTDFVSWGQRKRQFRPFGLFVLVLELFFEEVRHAWIRWRQRRHRWVAGSPRYGSGGQRPALLSPPRS
ncbi:MAG TPA: hypothetical protein VKA53_00005, partial [Thermoanaerobaculia bacterium]|nr:hypothetical protein [Thermoanaerobaculia bacterium]